MNPLRIALLAAALSGTVASATPFTNASQLGGSITISDGNYNGSAYGPVNFWSNHEDNEVERYPNNAAAGQQWDLEGMYLKGDILTLVGGYDFQLGTSHGGRTYRPGDIFIDVTGDAKYTHADNGGSGTSSNGAAIPNQFGYDYVISFSYNVSGIASYNVYSLTAGSMVKQVTDVPGSNAWRYASGGQAVAGYQNVALSNSGTLLPTVYSQLSTYTSFGTPATGLLGYNGNNTHNYITVDLTFLRGKDATFHYTMECGNDNLMGRAHVSETGSSILLVLGGLSMLGVLRRRK